MAKKTIAKFYSDISESEIDSDNPTVSFSIDGTSYEIDLTEAEHQALRDALAPYTAMGRKVTGVRRSTTSRPAATGGPKPADVRAWALEAGIEVPSRGRIPAGVTEQYEAAH